MGVEYIVPIIMAAVFLIGLIKGVDIFSAFSEGAKEGLMTAAKILPILIGLITVISIFRASGALDMFVYGLSPIGKFLHIPQEAFPLVLMRPISGSGSLALLADILRRYGADTYIGRIACVMTSSCETTIYTIAVYTQGAGIKKSGIALPSALIADIIAAACAVFAVNMFFK